MSENKNPNMDPIIDIATQAIGSLRAALETGSKHISDEAASLAGGKAPGIQESAQAIGAAALSVIGSAMGGIASVVAEVERAVTASTPTDAAPETAKTATVQPIDPTRPLAGKVALVTGSTSGIGLGIAHSLAAKGADIALNGFGNPEEIEALRASLESTYGVRAGFFPADLSKAEDATAMVNNVTAELGSVDILVNNAGIQYVSPIESFPEDRWDAIIAINLSSAFHAMKAAIPGMKARGWGRFINISSAHGLVGSPNKSAYVAAKHGLIGLTKVVALELANDGITANCICPGWVLTPMVEKQIADHAKENGTSIAEETAKLLGEKQPMKKFTTVEQIGGLAAHLCSELASTTTGTAMSVDGGWVAE